MVKNQKIKFLLPTIQKLIQKDDFARITYFPGCSKKCVMHIDKFWIFNFWKITHRSLKKGFDKDSKVKIVKQIFFCFFHAGRHGRLVFYPSQPHMGPIRLIKWSILAFLEKGSNCFTQIRWEKNNIDHCISQNWPIWSWVG